MLTATEIMGNFQVYRGLSVPSARTERVLEI